MKNAMDTGGMTLTQKRELIKKIAQKKRVQRNETLPAENDFSLFPEVQALQKQLNELRLDKIENPTFLLHQRPCGATTVVNGQEGLNFLHYNYLGMSREPEVLEAAKQAVELYGMSTGGSRLAGGELPIHRTLEKELADFIGVEDAVTFLGGHAANESTIGHLLGRQDLLLHDALAHNSILQGGQMAGVEMRAFPHLDWQAAQRILAESRHRYRRVMLAIEGAYSAEGNIPDLPKFIEIKEKHNALLFLDEAHSMGVLGETGRGICEHFGVEPQRVDILMGTLSKALGAAGGYIAGTKMLIRYLRYTAPGFVYSVGMSPPVAAAAFAALRILRAQPQRVECLRQRANLFRHEARRLRLDIGENDHGVVVPVYVNPTLACLRLSENLRKRGVFAGPMIPPVVTPGTSRLRFFVSIVHEEEQIRSAVRIVADELQQLERE